MFVRGLILLSMPQSKPGYNKFNSNVLKQVNPISQINDFFDRFLF